MKHLVLLVCCLALATSSAQAILLEDFSSFHQPDHTYFEGAWSAGAYEPRASFTQGDGVYEIKGSTNNQDNFVDIWFGQDGAYAPFNLTGVTHLALTAQVLPGNEATAIWIALTDRNMNEATAVFLTGDFSSTAPSLVLALIQVHSSTFDFSLVDRLRITGNLPLGQAAFNIAFDQIEATAVPEPSSYTVLLGAGALALSITRRRCFRSNRSSSAAWVSEALARSTCTEKKASSISANHEPGSAHGGTEGAQRKKLVKRLLVAASSYNQAIQGGAFANVA